MVRHTVAFTLKYPKGSPQEKEFLEATVALKKIHTGFIQQHWIPGVEDFLETDYELYSH